MPIIEYDTRIREAHGKQVAEIYGILKAMRDSKRYPIVAGAVELSIHEVQAFARIRSYYTARTALANARESGLVLVDEKHANDTVKRYTLVDPEEEVSP